MADKNLYDEISEEIIQRDSFKRTYEQLLKSQYIGTKKESNLAIGEIKFLLESSSVFAFSSSDKLKQMAYKIATILAEGYSQEYDLINQIAQYIIINIGQIPVIHKNVSDGSKDYFSTYEESEIPFNPFAYKNIILKQATNSIPVEFDKKKVLVTDFQAKSFYDLLAGKSISLSAPTSAGKSFILKSYLSTRFKEEKKFNVIYIVPTRALINQVQKDFKAAFRSFGVEEVMISSSSSSYNKETASLKNMFIFTQERFHNLLFDSDFEENLNVLIIDEAQKISDAERGILLEEVIEEAIIRNENLQKVFLSPFSKNPEKFAQIFHLEDLEQEKTKLSPVSQNILRLDIKNKNYNLQLSTIEFENLVEIESGTVDDHEDVPESKDWQLLWAAKKFKSNHNIIYCNSTARCVDNAIEFSSFLPDHDDEELNEIISYLKENVHSDYYLIKCLEKGVAYHYGKMPSQIRILVESLFINKKIKYIFCTSTLLEGVNLPAQNIFIAKPGRKGSTTPMNRLNFWNLAGRAGRLLKDYYGNVYCINIDEWPDYQPDPNDVEHEIESVLETLVFNNDKEIYQYLKDLYIKLKGSDRSIEQVITKFIIHELKYGNTEFISNLLKRNSEFEVDKLELIRSEIEKVASLIQIPSEVLQKNSAIDPRKQQELLEIFRKEQPVIPTHPTSGDSYHNVEKIYQFIDQFFLGMKKESKRHRYFTYLTFKWINDTNISELINSNIEYLKKDSIPTVKMINKTIEALFVNINDVIMFKYQKYLKCYIDILLHYYEESGYDPSKISDQFPMYLEFGSFKPNIIILQSIGISRSAAISINSLTKESFSDEADCIIWLKKNVGIIKEKYSPLIYDEVRSVV